MSSALLARVGSPADLKALPEKDLERLAAEMREELIRVVGAGRPTSPATSASSSSAWPCT